VSTCQVVVEFDWTPITLVRRKDLADISYTSNTIANFVSSFVAMAMGGRSGRICLKIIQYPGSSIPKTRC